MIPSIVLTIMTVMTPPETETNAVMLKKMAMTTT